MKKIFLLLAFACSLLFGLSSCENEQEISDLEYVPAKQPSEPSVYDDDPLWIRHHDSCFKILAIGNSFTINAATYMPWFINTLSGDSICIARLTRSGCSLDMHWNSHENDSPDYDLYFSDNGAWRLSDIKNIDRALLLFDWDVIVTQQASGWSGLYYTYQPYLDNLVRLFHEACPSALLAWHYTWAYTPWTKHTEFKNYDRDSEKMYDAIMDACDKASENFDIRIPSATLIKRMREEYPEVENGFSEDGYHIVDDIALYALSSLWFETMVYPYFGTSSLSASQFPENVNANTVQRALDIIADLTNWKEDPDNKNSVGMVTAD